MKKVCSIDGTNLLESNSQKIRNVVSKETADELTKMFEGVVERGTGVEARVRSIRIAGKTGTARRYENGKYIENSYTSLFIGFFPATDPQYICLIMMDKPKAKGYYGGVTSGPVFKAIAERTLGKLPNPQSLQQPVVLPELQVCVTMPDVRNLRFENALEVLEESELMIEESGNGEWVLSQSPLPGEKIVKNTKVRIARGTIQNEKWVIVPNLKGMSIRRAINRLLLEKLTYSVEGSGSVFQQRPSAGEKVIAGTCVKIVCKAKAMAESAF
jgi:membrane peptidoglycan carboxypeptidase